MKTAIRFHSKFGHTRTMAEAVKNIAGATPLDVKQPIREPVDVLFLGAGVMMGKVDGSVLSFIKTLTPDKVKRVVCFGSSAIIPSPVPQMRRALEESGIEVDERSFTCAGSMGPLKAGHPNTDDIENFKKFVSDIVASDANQNMQ